MATSKTLITKKIPLLLLNISFLFLVFLSFRLEFRYLNPSSALNFVVKSNACASLHDHAGYAEKCAYVESHPTCKPKGYINYLHIFYCRFGPSPLLGHALLLLWLLILFYLLGNTAADYFCPALESLSKILKLSPTIAGITLLSLGNGAPDVFASIISFTRSGDADVGLNSVLGGAFFVSSVVVGVLSIAMSFDRRRGDSSMLDRTGFIRDIVFFLFSLLSLLAILVVRRVNLWGAIAFFSIYFVYVCSVSATHVFCRNDDNKSDCEADETASIPLLGYIDDDDDKKLDRADSHEEKTSPIGHFLKQFVGMSQSKTPVLTPADSEHQAANLDRVKSLGKLVVKLLELPLYLPRRTTIPMVTEEQWSKPYAVASVTLAPILMAFLCNTQRENVDSRTGLVTYMAAVLVGMVLGNLAYVTTSGHGPPRQCLFPWLVAGFAMSVTWTYIVAEELVSLLVAAGNVFGVSPSVLGLTVLAWGNSLGDLIANVAMALRGGPDGAQIAVSGCYAGPMFNTVVGVGFSLVLSAWPEYPAAYEVPRDRSLYETVGFLMAGLLWALVVLPRNNMRLDRVLGIGLLAIYGCFLFVRLTGVPGFIADHDRRQNSYEDYK